MRIHNRERIGADAGSARHHSTFRLSAGAAFFLGGLSFPALVSAQEYPEPASSQPSPERGLVGTTAQNGALIEEILVTARKRQESLQDVPIAITAVTGESIAARAIDNLEDLSQTIPNVFIAENTTVDQIGIRGIFSGSNFGFEQAVGQIIDGYFYGRPRLTRIPFFDVERVEVLKGPQGALIGKNTTAGAINITTKMPTRTLEAVLTAQYEKFDDAGSGYTIDGAISGPITSNLRGRAAFYRAEGGGYIRNLANNTTVPDKDDWIGRIVLAWDPTDEIDVAFRWTRADLYREGQTKQLAFCSDFVENFLLRRGLGADCKGPPDKVTYALGPRNGQGNFDQFSTNLDLVGLTVNWQLGDHTLTSLTGYGQYSSSDNTEGDRTELEIQNTRLRDDYEQWSQEIRLVSPSIGQFTYIVGLYYSDRDNFNRFSFDTDFRPVFAPNPVPFPFPVPAAFPRETLSTNSFTQEDTKTYAAFGELTWNISDAFLLSVDGRYTIEEKKAFQNAFYGVIYSDEPFTPVPIPPFLQRPPFNLPAIIPSLIHDISGDRTEKNFSPGVTVQWKPDPDALLYASARRGFKGGGYNFGNLDPQSTVALTFEFEEETVTAFELGSKLTLGGGIATLNAALYYMKFDDLQVSTIDTRSLVGLALQRTTNAGSAISKGFEIDGTWAATNRLRFNFAVGYNDAKYEEYQGVPCFTGQTLALGCQPGATPSPRDDVQDLSGKSIANAPKWSGSGSAQYRFTLPGDLEVTTFAQALYRDSYFTLTTLDPVAVQPSYWKFDARISVADPDGRWNLSLIGRNLTDELTSSFIQPVAPIIENPTRTYNGFVDPGRSFVLQLRLSY